MSGTMKKVYDATHEERIRVVNELAEALARESSIAFAYLYGSFIDGELFHDVDVGVYLNRCEPDQDAM